MKLYSNWNYIEFELKMFRITEFEKFWQILKILKTLLTILLITFLWTDKFIYFLISNLNFDSR